MSAKDSGIGRAVPRKEDLRLLTGKGRYTDDLALPNQAYAVMVRSPHAHARIRGIDVAEARALPGVLTVLTGADVLADGLGSIPPDHFLMGPPEVRRLGPDIFPENRDGTPWFSSPYLPLPADEVRFVGEAVAMVVAESVALAKDGAQLVAVEYEPMSVVTSALKAAEPQAPLLWRDARSNVGLDADVGNGAATEAAFARAAHVVTLTTWVQRVTGVPMEPRAALGFYDVARDHYTLYAGSGGVQRQKREIAAILGVPEEKVRVVAGDIGGNFGTKNNLFPEFPLVCWASRRIGRPVKWTCERQEAFLSDHHARDLAVEAELALDAEGNFLGLRGSNVSNLGAHVATYGPLWKGLSIMSGNYRIPAAFFRGRGVVTTTMPTGPYRSAGRPEAIFVIERLVDLAARQLGLDRIALRRRNLVAPAAMPFRNPLGVTYDNGDYEGVMDRALDLADWAGFGERRAAARARGRLRGIGLANYLEITTGVPRERVAMTVHPEGSIDVVIGTLASGQGHETSFAQCVTEFLGVPIADVNILAGDTDTATFGGGSHSGRSMRYAAIVMGKASDEIIKTGRKVAALLLEAAEADIVYDDATFVVAGTDRSVDLFAVAAAKARRNDLPDNLRGPLAAICDEVNKEASFPFGCHVCEVEIDPDTGVVDLVRYSAIDDVGRAVNPLILHGQAHGSIVQGVGQALFEQCHYDAESGQLLTGSFLDYTMPRADVLPSLATAISEIPSSSNPYGMRSGGEGGTTPALAVVINAIVDALAEYGITHVEMPATSERVWRAIAAARLGGARDGRHGRPS